MPDDAPRVCLILTATITVNAGMPFTVRMRSEDRLADYRAAFARWLGEPSVKSILFIENSGYGLSGFEAMARRYPDKRVELVSFICPPFPNLLGKGYGEMIILEEAVRRSELLKASTHFVKVSGRYFIHNIAPLLRLPLEHPQVDVICNLSRNLRYSDSRAFGGSIVFLQNYLCPMRDQVNDSVGVLFEFVLARAAHRAMADNRAWSMTPRFLDIEGVSGSLGVDWKRGMLRRALKDLRHRILAKGYSL